MKESGYFIPKIWSFENCFAILRRDLGPTDLSLTERFHRKYRIVKLVRSTETS